VAGFAGRLIAGKGADDVITALPGQRNGLG